MVRPAFKPSSRAASTRIFLGYFDSDDEKSTLKRFHSEVGFIDPGHPPTIDLMADLVVFEVLDEIGGKETFADAVFAVEDEDESFFHSHWSGSSMNSTSAICGPSNCGFGAGRGEIVCGAGGAGLLPRRLGGGSFNTSRQNCRTVVSLISMPCRSRRIATIVS